MATPGPNEDAKQQHQQQLAQLEEQASALIDPALLRLTEGLPRWELDLVVKEADECEKALLKEIDMLEQAAAAKRASMMSSNLDSQVADSVDAQTKAMAAIRAQHEPLVPFQYGLGYPFGNVEEILASEYSTVDRFLTLSSLLGRLFWPTPLPDHHPAMVALNEDLRTKKEKELKKHYQQQLQEKAAAIQRQERLFNLVSHPNYTAPLATQEEIAAMQPLSAVSAGTPAASPPTLMSLWKKINQHKTALVFRKPVSDKDAPGYSERILFPMDLSLIKKMISNGIIVSLEQFHRKIVLICHNCVKFNGSASDYGIIARDFERYAEDVLWNALDMVVLSPTAISSPELTATGPELVSSAPEPVPIISLPPSSASSGVVPTPAAKRKSQQTSTATPAPFAAPMPAITPIMQTAVPATVTSSTQAAYANSPIGRGRGRPSKKKK